MRLAAFFCGTNALEKTGALRQPRLASSAAGGASAGLPIFLQKALAFCTGICYNSRVDTASGRLAQLVEHLLDVQEVTGSSPVPSTRTPEGISLRVFFCVPLRANPLPCLPGRSASGDALPPERLSFPSIVPAAAAPPSPFPTPGGGGAAGCSLVWLLLLFLCLIVVNRGLGVGYRWVKCGLRAGEQRGRGGRAAQGLAGAAGKHPQVKHTAAFPPGPARPFSHKKTAQQPQGHCAGVGLFKREGPGRRRSCSKETCPQG